MDISSNNNLNSKFLYITGAGGQSTNSLNISTLSAIVACSYGLKILKHVSYDGVKKCSSIDFLDALGIKISKTIQDIENNVEKHSIAFIEAMPEHVLDNLCPLLAPVSQTTRFIGISDINCAMKYLFELKNKGYKRAMVVCSSSPLFDEINISGCSQIFELIDGEIKNYVITPVDFGIEEADPISITGATPLYNSNLSRDILNKKVAGSKLDVIAMNVGAMIYISGLADSLKKGIIEAYKCINSYKAADKLESLRG